MPKPKGAPKTGGRRKGVQNKISLSLKEDVLAAYNKLGGVDYLTSLGLTDQKTFVALLAKILPHEIAAQIQTQANINQTTKIIFEKFDGDEIK
jgi:hypothetical protein